MTNPKFLSFLKIVFTIILCVCFGFVYGKFLSLFGNILILSSRWVYIVLAIPIFLPIFEYLRTEYKKRPKFSSLIKELVFTFISALITVFVLANFEFGDEYQDYIMSAIGLVSVILLANLLSFGLKFGVKLVFSKLGSPKKH
jgi:hypothetical protein